MAFINARHGMGDYDAVGSYQWMFNPPPFGFLNPAGIAPPPEFYAPAGSMGLGGLGCGCGCSGSKSCGVGDVTPTMMAAAPAALLAIAAGGILLALAQHRGRRRRR